MKNIHKLLLSALVALQAQAGLAQTPTPVNSQITDATVYLSQAQVTRFAQPNLQVGENLLVLKGLGNGIDPNSIQVSAPQDVLINSVMHEVNYMNGLQQPKRISALVDSTVLVRDLMARIAADLQNLEAEKAMLNYNQKLAGEQNGVDVLELEKAANFFRIRHRDINEKILALQKKNVELANRLNKINSALAELNANLNRPSNDIVIKLSSPAAKRVDLEVRYLIYQASWTPGYDVRAKDTQSPIRIDYRADVVQLSGEDWENVRLKLSTGNPSMGGTPPVVSQWNLYAYDNRPVSYPKKATATTRSAAAPEMSGGEDLKSEDGYAETNSVQDEISFDAPATTLANYTEVRAGATTAEFVIQIPQTIKSGEKPQQVSVQSSELPAIYSHFAVPKLDLEAFLTARITDWEKLNLLPGVARIFFEGTYVTEAYLDPALTDDTLSLSLGRDPKVVISRELLKDFSKSRTIGLNREKTIAWEIKVKNTKSTPARITLEDQVPISMDKDIIVKVEDISGAVHNLETGKLTWDLQLAPGESKTLRLVFTVKHPKNKPVAGI